MSCLLRKHLELFRPLSGLMHGVSSGIPMQTFVCMWQSCMSLCKNISHEVFNMPKQLGLQCQDQLNSHSSTLVVTMLPFMQSRYIYLTVLPFANNVLSAYHENQSAFAAYGEKKPKTKDPSNCTVMAIVMSGHFQIEYLLHVTLVYFQCFVKVLILIFA